MRKQSDGFGALNDLSWYQWLLIFILAWCMTSCRPAKAEPKVESKGKYELIATIGNCKLYKVTHPVGLTGEKWLYWSICEGDGTPTTSITD